MAQGTSKVDLCIAHVEVPGVYTSLSMIPPRNHVLSGGCTVESSSGSNNRVARMHGQWSMRVSRYDRDHHHGLIVGTVSRSFLLGGLHFKSRHEDAIRDVCWLLVVGLMNLVCCWLVNGCLHCAYPV